MKIEKMGRRKNRSAEPIMTVSRNHSGVNMLNRDRCSRPRCRGNAWVSQIAGSPICRKHTERMFISDGNPVLFNRNTYVCERNKMHLG